MILDNETIEILNNYLPSELGPLSAADPKVLTEYVIALLKHDKPEAELMDYCVQNLAMFLSEGASSFVQQLFKVLGQIKSGTFNSKQSVSSSSSVDNDDYDDESLEDSRERNFKHARSSLSTSGSDVASASSSSSYDSRKRRDDGEDRSSRYDREDRRGGGRRDEGMDYDRNRKRDSDRGERGRRNYGSTSRYDNTTTDARKRPRFNTNNNDQTILAGGVPSYPRKPRCKDYDEKGICLRGASCMFDHGSDTIVMPTLPEYQEEYVPQGIAPPEEPFNMSDSLFPTDAIVLTKAAKGTLFTAAMPPGGLWQGQTTGGGPAFRGQRVSGDFQVGKPTAVSQMPPVVPNYHHHHPSADQQSYPTPNPIPYSKISAPIPSPANQIPTGTGPSFQPQVASDFSFKAERAQRPFDKTSTTLLIASIPKELNTIAKLNEHFSTFGTVVNIQVKPTQNQAYVQFSSNNEALAALRSPQAVLNNRFIKVFWAGGYDATLPSPPNFSETSTTPKQTPTPPKIMSTPTHTAPMHTGAPAAHTTTTAAPVAPAKPAVDPNVIAELKKKKEELRKKQLEQQKILLEKLSNKNLNPKEKAILQEEFKQLSELLSKSLKKDVSTLATKATPAAAKDESKKPSLKSEAEAKQKEVLDRELELFSKPASGSPVVNRVQTEKLESTLGALHKEAEELGISLPSGPKAAAPVVTKPIVSHPAGRGRGRGRGAPYPPSAGRGRGKGLVLDNRPSTVWLTNLPSALQDESALRAHLQPYASTARILISNGKAMIGFDNRSVAEAALGSGKWSYNGQPLEYTWVADTKKKTPTANGSSTTTTATTAATPEPTEEQENEEDYEEESEDGEKSWKR